MADRYIKARSPQVPAGPSPGGPSTAPDAIGLQRSPAHPRVDSSAHSDAPSAGRELMSQADKSAPHIPKTKPRNHRAESHPAHPKSGAMPVAGVAPMPGSQPPGSDAYFGHAQPPSREARGVETGRPAASGAPPGSPGYYGKTAAAGSAAGTYATAGSAPISRSPAAVGHPPGSAAYFGETGSTLRAPEDYDVAQPKHPSASAGYTPRPVRTGPNAARAPRAAAPVSVGQPPGSAAYLGGSRPGGPARPR